MSYITHSRRFFLKKSVDSKDSKDMCVETTRRAMMTMVKDDGDDDVMSFKEKRRNVRDSRKILQEIQSEKYLQVLLSKSFHEREEEEVSFFA